MFRFIRAWFSPAKSDVIVREEVETDERGCPKVSALTKPPEYYIRLYEQGFQLTKELPVAKPGHPGWDWYTRQISNAYNNRVVATWGMIARGVKSLPYALTMMKSGQPDIREDGAGVLMALGKQPGVVEELLNALGRETETQARDAIIIALGEIKDKRAIPALARIIRQPGVDGDTQWTAIESLGSVVHRKFTDKPNVVEAALEWLSSHGH